MAYGGMGAFARALEERGELVRIRRESTPSSRSPRSPTASMKAGGPALLFENVARRPLPRSSSTPTARARGCRSRSASTTSRSTRAPSTSSSARAPRRARASSPQLALEAPRARARPAALGRRRARCQDVVRTGDDVDLDVAPHPHVAGPTTAARSSRCRNVITRDPETGARNVGMYRMQKHRPPHDGDALADAQDGRAPLPPRERAGPPAARGRRRARRRPGADVRGDRAAARRDRRVDVRGLPAQARGQDREVQDRRPRGPGRRRLRARGLRRPAARSSSTRGRSAITPATTRPSTTSRAST